MARLRLRGAVRSRRRRLRKTPKSSVLPASYLRGEPDRPSSYPPAQAQYVTTQAGPGDHCPRPCWPMGSVIGRRKGPNCHRGRIWGQTIGGGGRLAPADCEDKGRAAKNRASSIGIGSDPVMSARPTNMLIRKSSAIARRHGGAEVRRALHHGDARRFERAHLLGRRALAARDDRAGVAYSASRRRRPDPR